MIGGPSESKSGVVLPKIRRRNSAELKESFTLSPKGKKDL